MIYESSLNPNPHDSPFAKWLEIPVFRLYVHFAHLEVSEVMGGAPFNHRVVMEVTITVFSLNPWRLDPTVSETPMETGWWWLEHERIFWGYSPSNLWLFYGIFHGWLVVTGTWLDYEFPFRWEFHDPNWWTHICQMGWNHRPVDILMMLYVRDLEMWVNMLCKLSVCKYWRSLVWYSNMASPKIPAFMDDVTIWLPIYRGFPS